MISGSLENEIMNAVWSLEESSATEISVADVVKFINNNSSVKKAYTTIKTVMDRLVDKEYLNRIKTGKKFCYTSTSSRTDSASTAIRNLASRYFNNDMQSFMKALEKECLKK